MRARRILYWVAIAVLVAIMIGCAGAIAYKFITDAKEQYLKLFTYVDEDPEMGMQDILKYAGMLSFKDEQLYVDLSAYFAKK